MITNTKLLEIALQAHTTHKDAFAVLTEITEALKSNVREETARKAGKGNKVKILEKLLKENNNDTRFTKAHAISDKYYFISPHRFFVDTTDNGFTHADQVEVFTSVWHFISDLKQAATSTITLDRSKIETFIKISGQKRTSANKKPFVCKTENGRYIGFNPFYLLDFIDYSGATSAIFSKESRAICDENETAFLLPVNLGTPSHAYNNEDYKKWCDTYFGESEV